MVPTMELLQQRMVRTLKFDGSRSRRLYAGFWGYMAEELVLSLK